MPSYDLGKLISLLRWEDNLLVTEPLIPHTALLSGSRWKQALALCPSAWLRGHTQASVISTSPQHQCRRPSSTTETLAGARSEKAGLQEKDFTA